jgi:hypothetical protein
VIVVHFKGGLGNQFFQYAAGRTLAARHSVPLVFDTRWYAESRHQSAIARTFDLTAFNVVGRLAQASDLEQFAFDYRRTKFDRLRAPLVRLRWNATLWRSEDIGFNIRFNELGSNVLLDGYFQHPSYFTCQDAALRAEFRLLDLPANVVARSAELASIDSVCIQVRRTDFVANPETARVHGSCDVKYFERSWSCLRERRPDALGFVFADDTEWAETTFRGWCNVQVVGREWDGPQYLHRFQLMRSCRHFVIANSTWGWWAAWLGARPESVVVMPKRWFLDRNANAAASGLCLPGWHAC